MIENTSMFLDFLDPIDREIILNQKFENKEITDLLHLMKKYSIKTFFDLGANCGYYSIKVLKEISEVKVIAFEPNKEAYSKFNKTILVNSQFSKNIKIENFGLSNQNALLKMKFLKKYDYNQTGGSSVISDFDINEKNFFYATFKIGDEILDFKNQKLCFKIDVERHEINVIQGLKKTLKDNDSLILIEIYKKNNRKDLLDVEQSEADVLSNYLPKQLSEEETKSLCQEVVGKLNAQSIKDMGKVMGELKKNYSDSLDFSKAGSILKEILNK